MSPISMDRYTKYKKIYSSKTVRHVTTTMVTYTAQQLGMLKALFGGFFGT